MTVIAWDGAMLAADKMTSFGGLHGTTTKVHRIGSLLVGGCGNTAMIQEMLIWIRNGRQADKFPERQRDPQECTSIMVIPEDSVVLQYENTPYPLVIQNPYWAIGSGRDFAMAAMFLGKTALEAVEVANALCNDCGNGADVMLPSEVLEHDE